MSISNLEIKKLPKSQIEITGEIPAEEFEGAWQNALKELNDKTNLPGFRPGHIPERTLLDRIGEQTVTERAAEIALQKTYPEIIKQNKIAAIGHPQITITKIARKNPLGFKAVTAVLPQIILPDYKELAREKMAEKLEILVSEKEIEESLDYLRKTKNKEQLPELNDDFAKSVGNFNTVDELKNAIRQNLLLDKERRAKEARRMATLEQISKKCEIEIPEILVEAEKNKMLEELRASIAQFGLKWADYLLHIKKTEEELINGWQQDAEKRSRYGLVLREIADKEKLEPAAEELENYALQIISQEPESERQKIDKERVKDYAYGILRNEKVFKFLENL